MATRLGKFELPNRLVKEEETATEKYAKFIADPFESGYGHARLAMPFAAFCSVPLKEQRSHL